MAEATIKPTFDKPISDLSKGYQKNFDKALTQQGIEKLNEVDEFLSEAEQSLKKKIFSLAKMEALVFSDPKLSAVYEEMSVNGEEKYGYHYNETIMNMLFNDYVLDSPKYLQKYKQAIPKEKKRRDKSGINQLKKSGEKTMNSNNFKPKKLAPTGLKPVDESDEPLTKVQFLVNEKDPENPDLFAYFPEENYDRMGNTQMGYSHIGQHSAVHTEYAEESREATPEEYADLKAELEGLGYNLEVLNPANNTIGESGEMLAQYVQNAFTNRQGNTPINFVVNYLKNKYGMTPEEMKELINKGDDINMFFRTNPNPDKLKVYADEKYHEIKNPTNEMSGTGGGASGMGSAFGGGSGQYTQALGNKNIDETTGSASSGAYVGPAVWGSGDLMKVKGKSRVKKVPMVKGGTFIQESKNYLVEPDGFEKFYNSLNEDDSYNKIANDYQATHTNSNKGLGVSELPQPADRKNKEKDIDGNSALYIGQDVAKMRKDDVNILHNDMTKKNSYFPHKDNPNLKDDGIAGTLKEENKSNADNQIIDKTNAFTSDTVKNWNKNDTGTEMNTLKTGDPDKANLKPMEETKKIDEKAVSKKQQKFMGMVHAVQKGELSPDKVGSDVADAAKSMKKSDAEDFASTKHKGLPEKVKPKKLKEETLTMIADKPDSMSNKAVATGSQSSGVPMGLNATGGGISESHEKLLEEINNELKAFSIHHDKLKKMTEERRPSALILKDRLGNENKANFKKDLKDSSIEKIVDIENSLEWQNQQTEVKNPQELGEKLEKGEIKATDAKSGEALKNVGDSANDKGDEIPKRNLSDEEQDEVNNYRLGLGDLVYDNEVGKRFEDRMKADMGDKLYKQRQAKLAFRGKAPMYNKDPQPVEDTTANKVQFDKEQTGWNEREGLKEGIITGKYFDNLAKKRIIDFNLNEVWELKTDKPTEFLCELNFDGLGNTYTQKVSVNENVIKAMSGNKFFTNGAEVFVLKTPAQSLNESEQKAKKPVVNEQMEKMKHLVGYNTATFVKQNKIL